MRDILQDKLLEREEQAQSREVADGDDDQFRPIGRRGEMIGHRLAIMVSEGTEIDTTAETERTEWVNWETFPGNIATFAADKKKSAEQARKHTDGQGELFFWTDGSRLHSRHTEVSEAWRNPYWKMQKTYLGTNKEVCDTELYAMGDAMEIALR